MLYVQQDKIAIIMLQSNFQSSRLILIYEMAHFWKGEKSNYFYYRDYAFRRLLRLLAMSRCSNAYRPESQYVVQCTSVGIYDMKEEAICWKNPIIASGKEGSHLCFFIVHFGERLGKNWQRSSNCGWVRLANGVRNTNLSSKTRLLNTWKVWKRTINQQTSS